MNFLLYNKKSYITARSLATQLGLSPVKNVRRLVVLDKPPLIRYGCSNHNFGERDTKINSPQAIRNCANAIRFSEICNTIHDIYTPYYKKFDAYNIPEFPFLLRAAYHRAGKDIIYINSQSTLDTIPIHILRNRYTVPYIKTKFELRVHIAFGKVLRIFKKVMPTDFNKEYLIRSMSNGWHYSLRNNSMFLKAQQLSINVADRFGLAFCGVDIAWDLENNRYIIWEVNTAPGLSQNTMNLYANSIREYL